MRGLSACARLLLIALAVVPSARAVTLRAVTHIHSRISHNGTEPLDVIAAKARAKGIDVFIPTDSLTADWEYGLWPLRGLIRKKVSARSVLSYGIENYLEEVKALRRKIPDLVVIPGVEAAAYYRWEGVPWRHLTINDYNRHMLIIGPEQASAYARLPAAGNPGGERFDWLKLWPLAPLAIAAAAWRSTRRRRYALISLICLILFVGGWPYRAAADSRYARQTPWEPYQALIDSAHGVGALVFWAHPDSPSWGGQAEGPRVSVRTEPYPEALLRTVGFDGFAAVHEGMRGAASAGGTWDEALLLYVKGRRERPCWAIGELDYRNPAQTPVDSAQIVLEARSRSGPDVLEALRLGRFYSLQRSDHSFALRRFTLSSASASASAGETLRGSDAPTLELELAFEDGASAETTVEIVRDGKLVRKEPVSVPGRWSYSFAADAPRSYYRVIARQGNNILVSNPIFASTKHGLD